jgi:hypothetical protein
MNLILNTNAGSRSSLTKPSFVRPAAAIENVSI